MQRSKRMIFAAAAAAVSSVSFWQFKVQGATFTWSGAGTDANLTTPGNWVNNLAPGATTDFVVFSTATPASTAPSTNGGAVNYGSISFLAGIPPFTISGSNALTVGASVGGVVLTNNTVGVNQTFGAPVSIAGGTVNMAAGGFVFNGPVNIGAGTATNNVTVIGASTVSFNGGLTTGGASINFGSGGSGNDAAANFTGEAILNTDNSGYTGQMFINGGSVLISNSNALGTGTVTTQLSSGGTGKGYLALTGGITVNTNVVTRARSNIGSIMLENISGTNTINNVFTNTGGSTFSYDSSAGTLIIGTWNTTATSTGRILNLSGAGNGQINNWTLTGTTTITLNKSGAGQWILGAGMGNGTGSFVATNVTGGTLTFDTGLGTHMFGSATISSGATLEDRASNGVDGELGNGITPTTIAVNAGGTFDASSFTQYNLQVSQTFIGGGTVKVGQMGFFGDSTVYIGNTAAAAAGTLAIQGSLNINHAFASPTGGLHFDLASTNTVGGGVNDLMTISNNLTLDSSSGQIPVFINPIGGVLANGAYTLVQYGGSLSGSASDLILSGAASGGTTRQNFTLDTSTTGEVNLLVSGAPASLVWKGDGGGNPWDVVTTADWLNGASADKFFQFDNVLFNDTSANKTVNIGTLVSPSSLAVNTASTYLFNGSGTISGATGITKSGTGTAIFANSGTNAFTGAITISGGTLQFGDGGTDGNFGSGSITNNGALVVNANFAQNLSQVVSGTGQLVQNGTGTLSVTGSNTFTGPVTVQGGQMIINNPASLGDTTGNTTVLSGAELAVNSGITVNEPLVINGQGIGAVGGALHAGGATTPTWAGAITLGSDAAIKVDGGATLTLPGTITGTNTNLTLNADPGGTGVITGSVNLGTGGLIKGGAGTWVLASQSITYSGPTAINAGVLQYGNSTVAGNAVIPTGTIPLNGGTVSFNNAGSYAVGATITGTGGVALGPGGGTVTLTGNLTGFTGALVTLPSGTLSPNSMLIVPVATGATSLFITDTNLSGIGQGIIRLTNSNAIASGASFETDVSQAAGTGRLEVGNSVNLNFGTMILHPRNNNTPTILALDGNDVIHGPMRIDNGGSTVNFQASLGSTLTFTDSIHPASATEAPATAPGSSRVLALTGAGEGTFQGVITNRPDLATVGIIVVKAGSGTWHLTGANDYIGNMGNTVFQTNVATIVQNGTLELSTASQNPVLANTNTSAFTDIQGGRLALDYSGATIAPTITGLLKTSFNSTGGFNNTTASIRSTTATGTLGLGMTDDGVSKVTVGFTVFGDANLDGKVNALDFNALASGFGSGTFWYQGDFNYDGVVNTADFMTLSQDFGGIAPTPTAAPVLSPVLGALVPEPMTTGAVLMMAGMAITRRRRRLDK